MPRKWKTCACLQGSMTTLIAPGSDLYLPKFFYPDSYIWSYTYIFVLWLLHPLSKKLNISRNPLLFPGRYFLDILFIHLIWIWSSNEGMPSHTSRWLASGIRSAPISLLSTKKWECALESGADLRISVTVHYICVSSLFILFYLTYSCSSASFEE